MDSKIFQQLAELAEAFNENPTNSNAEKLAKESVNAEKAFESNFRQNPGDCEDIMKDIFGSENQRQDEKRVVQYLVV